MVSFETIEHLKEPELFLQEVRRVVKPGGTFIGSVPNMWVDENGNHPTRGISMFLILLNWRSFASSSFF